MFNLAGSLSRGHDLADQMRETRKQNSLAQLYRDHGSGIANGEANALSELAKLDPMQAHNFRISNANERRAGESHGWAGQQHGLNLEQTRAQVQSIKQQTASRVRQEAARLDAATREADMREVHGVLAGGKEAFKNNSLSAWVQLNSESLLEAGIDPNQVNMETAPMIFAALAGTIEGIEAAGTYMKDFGPSTPDLPASAQSLAWRAEQAGLVPGSPEYQQFMVNGGATKAGTSFTVGPDGGVEFSQGGSSQSIKSATVDENRNAGFFIRAQNSNDILSSLDVEGGSLSGRAKERVPGGNFLQTAEYQKFEQARRDFVNAILRRESGAVISDDEFANADKQYFPQPGDSQEVIEQKRRNRDDAIQGLEIGSGRALPNIQKLEANTPTLRYNPETGEIE